MADKHKKNRKFDMHPSETSALFAKRPRPPISKEKQEERKKRKRTKKRTAVKDEISGCIMQKCNEEPEVYWRSIGIDPLPSCSLTVLNSSDFPMTVRADTDGKGVADTILFKLTEKNQTKSITLNSIASLIVSFEGEENQMGNGRYSLTIAYHKTSCI